MDTKAIVVADGRELLVSDIAPQVTETARKLMKLTPGGSKMDVNQATELAVFSIVNGLNPFEGEAYHVFGVGPYAGVAGYRRKATEYLIERYGPAASYWLEYRPANTSEAQFNPDKGDIAWVVRLHDSEMEKRWQAQVIQNLIGVKAAGITGKEAFDMAAKLAGPKPYVEAVGVVYASESFAKEGKVERWDRNERAKKRGEKQVLRRAYPVGVRIMGDADMGDVIEGTARDLVMDVSSQIAAEASKPRPEGMTNEKILADMDYSPVVVQPAFVPTEPPPTPEPEYVPVEEAPVTIPPPSVITPQQAAVDAGACPDIFQANAWYERCKGSDKNDPEKFIKWSKVGQGWLDIGADLEQASSKANKGDKPK